MDDILQLSDLSIVGHLGESVLFFVRNEDISEENPLAIEYLVGRNEYYIDLIGRFGKFVPFTPIPKDEIEDYSRYARRILPRKMRDETIINSLVDFTEAVKKVEKAEDYDIEKA